MRRGVLADRVVAPGIGSAVASALMLPLDHPRDVHTSWSRVTPSDVHGLGPHYDCHGPQHHRRRVVD
jgi:hypothetical protein